MRLPDARSQADVEVRDASAAQLRDVELVLGGCGRAFLRRRRGVHGGEGLAQLPDLLRQQAAEPVGEAVGHGVDLLLRQLAGGAEAVVAGASREGVDEEPRQGEGARPLLQGGRGLDGPRELVHVQATVLVSVECADEEVSASHVVIRDLLVRVQLLHGLEQAVLVDEEDRRCPIEGAVHFEEPLYEFQVAPLQASLNTLLDHFKEGAY
mmetsp:Transcript_33504/g.70215  ORF Transcript_33504/g.70215 Transcript_33504/m.70215 type:complete len:209 (+) Transcript_33504:977-1603(+)